MSSEVKTTSAKATRGYVRFEMRVRSKTVGVHLDRRGLRRLLETLERLTLTGERQGFGSSGIVKSGNGKAAVNDSRVSKLVFHLHED